MTLAGGLEPPLIGRIVLLADESAHYVVAGLSQLDRLLRTLEECFAPALARGDAPEVLVVWKSPALFERRTTRLQARFVVDGPIKAPPSGDTLVLRTDVTFRRGVLARLLHSPGPSSSFAVLGSREFPADWETLWARVGACPDESTWVLNHPAEIPQLERQLIRATGKPTDGLVARNLNRPISQSLSRLLVQTRVTPNQVSFLVLMVLMVSVWILAQGTPLGFVIGMLLFHLASVLDGCDGEIARAKFLESPLGSWLDTSVDLLGNALLALAVAVGLSRQPGLPVELRNTYLLEGVLTTLAIGLGLFGLSRAHPGRSDFNDFGSSLVARFRIPRPLIRVFQTVIALLRRDSYAVVFVLFAVFGQPEWILHVMAIAVALHLPVIGWSVWSNARMAARLKAPDRR